MSEENILYTSFPAQKINIPRTASLMAGSVDGNTITLWLGEQDKVKLEIVFSVEGILLNGIHKDVDSEWPEIYAAFKKFVSGTNFNTY